VLRPVLALAALSALLVLPGCISLTQTIDDGRFTAMRPPITGSSCVESHTVTDAWVPRPDLQLQVQVPSARRTTVSTSLGLATIPSSGWITVSRDVYLVGAADAASLPGPRTWTYADSGVAADKARPVDKLTFHAVALYAEAEPTAEAPLAIQVTTWGQPLSLEPQAADSCYARPVREHVYQATAQERDDLALFGNVTAVSATAPTVTMTVPSKGALDTILGFPFVYRVDFVRAAPSTTAAPTTSAATAKAA
jgi:hypothetical protein